MFGAESMISLSITQSETIRYYASLKRYQMNHTDTAALPGSNFASPHTQKVETAPSQASRANKETKSQIQTMGLFIGQLTQFLQCHWVGVNLERGEVNGERDALG